MNIIITFLFSLLVNYQYDVLVNEKIKFQNEYFLEVENYKSYSNLEDNFAIKIDSLTYTKIQLYDEIIIEEDELTDRFIFIHKK